MVAMTWEACAGGLMLDTSCSPQKLRSLGSHMLKRHGVGVVITVHVRVRHRARELVDVYLWDLQLSMIETHILV